MKVCTMTIQPGEFWIADITFTSGSGSKKRPVAVRWLDGADLVAAAVTTAPPRSQFDVALNDWKSSGLRRASTVRLSRLDCLEQSLLVARIGVISATDGARVKEIWQKHVKPQF
jgi:PemK-like, MazF-like toxin of type II toxin-antitoxin system